MYKNDGSGIGMWFDKHARYISMIVDEEHLRRCVGCKHAWTSVADSLRVVCKSKCGNRIFGSKLQLVASEAVSASIDTEVETFKNGDMTAATVQACLERAAQVCKDLGRDFQKKKGPS